MSCKIWKRVREVAQGTVSRASTILAEERQMALTETDFINIKEKMNKIDQRIRWFISKLASRIQRGYHYQTM